MGWGDALGGDAPRPAPLDSCLRRNDGEGVGDGEGCWGVGALRQAQGERGCGWRLRRGGGGPRAAPLPWVPAFAGTTGGCRGRRGLLVGGALRQAQGERGCGWRLRWGGGGGWGWGAAPRRAPALGPRFLGNDGEGVGDGEGCWGVGALRQAQGERGVDGCCDGGVAGVGGGGVGGIGGLWVLGVCYGCWGVEAGAGRMLACAAERLIGVDVETCRRWGAIPVSQISGGRDDLLL